MVRTQLGAISLEMKNGFDFEGVHSTLSGGSYRRTNEVLEYGKILEMWLYIWEQILIMMVDGEITLNPTFKPSTVMLDTEMMIQNCFLT